MSDAHSQDLSTDTQDSEPLIQLVYLSSSAAQYSSDDLMDILKISRRNNSARDITGLLLYHNGNIIQFLEGAESAVQAVYDTIARDHRHKGVLPLLRRKVSQRDFGNWSMGYKNIQDDEKAQLEGFNDLMNALSSHTVADPSISKPVQRLIRSFRQVCASDS